MEFNIPELMISLKSAEAEVRELVEWLAIRQPSAKSYQAEGHSDGRA
ncbi:hypothetical protein MES5069_60107 [Mesorhizobium escarrei]|uniref:Uncharacterized protein n=1 Tax=Mesorhizobium escarrei TaxID=666018 RepID=A0ABN8KDF3_9HYPH|nr:hypothetical protein MES5069_60107 [Mesorhizobium escarrei]